MALLGVFGGGSIYVSLEEKSYLGGSGGEVGRMASTCTTKIADT